MKTQISNIALEGTRSGDVVGGLLLWAVESLQAPFFAERGLSNGGKFHEEYEGLPICRY
jgi:hypothetical protein